MAPAAGWVFCARQASTLGLPSRGFTLLELLLVAALSAVLACIAYPSWSRVWLSAQRAQARQALAMIHAAQLDFRLQHNQWALAMTELNLPRIEPSGRYTLHLEPSGGGWMASAQAVGPQAADSRCAVLEIEVDAHSLHRRAYSVAGPVTDPGQLARCWGE